MLDLLPSLSFQMDISFFSFYFRLTQESFVRGAGRDVVCVVGLRLLLTCWPGLEGRKEGRKRRWRVLNDVRFGWVGEKGPPFFYFILDVTNFFPVLILYSLARPCVSFFLFLLLLPHYVETHQKAEHIKC